ncbi:hypothetical protein LTR17_023447, partial [Elasticomyces elasticus]
MADLAATYRNQGRWKKAEELEVEVMEASRRVLGGEHPSTLSSMANLTATYCNQGRRNEAKYLLQEAVDSSAGMLGDSHPDTLAWRSALAEPTGHKTQAPERSSQRDLSSDDLDSREIELKPASCRKWWQKLR